MNRHPLDYQRATPVEHSGHGQTVGLLAGLACAPVLLGVVTVLWMTRRWTAAMILSPYVALVVELFPRNIYVAILVCLAQWPLYGWLIGRILTADRWRLPGILAFVAGHGAIVGYTLMVMY